MSHLRHPPPPSLHGLLTIRLPRSRRMLRHIRLINNTLEVRVHPSATPILSHTLGPATRLQSHRSALHLTVTTHAATLHLHPPTASKFHLWHAALAAAAAHHLSTYYAVVTTQPPLGRGLFAEVRPALTVKEPLVPVAVKTVHLHPRDGPYRDLLVRRECRIARLVRHSAIVPVLDVFETASRVDIVMKQVPYTLHHLMFARVTVGERDAAAIMNRLLSAVAYLHAQNIVHRDIKPDNILCDNLDRPAESVVLCDFGLANFVDGRRGVAGEPGRVRRDDVRAMGFLERHGWEGADDAAGAFSTPMYLRGLVGQGRGDGPWAMGKRLSTFGYRGRRGFGAHTGEGEAAGTRFGTSFDGMVVTSAVGAPSYVAPEVVKGWRYGTGVDVWGCGVVLYYMLVGYLPVEGGDVRQVLRGVREFDVDFEGGSWGRVSDAAKEFVRSLMQPDPSRRITAERALQHKWLVLNTGPLTEIAENM